MTRKEKLRMFNQISFIISELSQSLDKEEKALREIAEVIFGDVNYDRLMHDAVKQAEQAN